jgi:hypothetical protein
MKYLILALTLSLALLGGTALAGVPDDLQQISVTIKSGDAQGSGNIVTRKVGDDTVSFVWTAAHVVDNLRTTRTIVTPSGGTKTLIEYRDAEIVQERQQGGRRVGEVKFDAKVIKVSDADYGEDLALLMVRCKNAYPLSISTRYHLEADYLPSIGVELAHCGSLLGQFGANSYTTGVLSQTGRTLSMKGANVKVFDQVTAVAFPGSSGGGMYIKADGLYVGMLTQGVMKLQGFNFIVPVRRIHAFAKAARIEWAIDPSVEMPSLKQIEAINVEDAAVVGSGRDTPELSAPCKGGFDFNGAAAWVERFSRSLIGAN